jgi:hypothetical protein
LSCYGIWKWSQTREFGFVDQVWMHHFRTGPGLGTVRAVYKQSSRYIWSLLVAKIVKLLIINYSWNASACRWWDSTLMCQGWCHLCLLIAARICWKKQAAANIVHGVSDALCCLSVNGPFWWMQHVSLSVELLHPNL